MIVRSVDDNNDWNFGRGRNDYKRDRLAVMQNVQTRLQEFLGDCFFNTVAGIDWLNLLGSKDIEALKLRISSVIINTEDISGLIQTSIRVSETRKLFITYEADTIYGSINDEFSLNIQDLVE